MWQKYKDAIEGSFDESYTHCLNYEIALKRVLFKGFELSNENCFVEYSETIKKDYLHVFWFNKYLGVWVLSKGLLTIEDLTKYNLELTETTIKKLGL